MYIYTWDSICARSFLFAMLSCWFFFWLFALSCPHILISDSVRSHTLHEHSHTSNTFPNAFFYVSTSTDKVCTHIHGHFIPWNKCSFWSWRLLFIILSLNICLLTFAHFELSNVICYIIFRQNLPDRPYVLWFSLSLFRQLKVSWSRFACKKFRQIFFLLLFFIKDALFPRITFACNKIYKQRFKLPYLFPFYTYKYVRYV